MAILGNMYRSMMISGANFLDNEKEKINALNVFPVPDGDTGINMSLTMGKIHDVASDLPIGETADKVAGIMLRCARGNSGAILSLYFRGIAKALKGKTEAETGDLVSAFERGTAEAYKAVMKPTEGTMLTVMRESSEQARAAFDKDPSMTVEQLFELLVREAEASLSRTPELLPVLKQAGVVDAGGSGFLHALVGMQSALSGEPIELVGGESEPAETREAADFSEFDTGDIVFGYCTECIIEKNEQYLGEDTAGGLYEFIKEIGDSAVFVDDENIIKLHIHTNDPGAVLTRAINFGSLATVKIENMRNQHTALSSGADKGEKKAAPKVAKNEKKYGFVSVCMGDGIRDMFIDLGADSIIAGGQTMNPSTQEIIDAVLRTPSEYVFILPNNKNICMVARQAAEIVREKKVVVIPTETVPQGMSAMIAFNPDAEVEQTVREMKEAMQMVTSMSVTYAVRNTQIDRFAIREGQFLGLVEGKIACVTDTINACMKQLSRGMTGASFVTVFYGEDIKEAEAEKVGKMISEKLGGACEVAVLSGGQPIYSYIVSVEQ